MMKISVIVTTYNRPDALAAVLRGYAKQTDPSFEILVADDGSTSQTANVIQQFSIFFSAHSLHHVWHPDQGFRAAAIRNRALARATGSYIIFTDGDCIPPRHFIAAHRRLAERGWFLSANRLLLSARFTQQILQQALPVEDWSALAWGWARMRGKVNRWLPLLRLPDGSFRKTRPTDWEGIKTCNMSAWRDDLIRINGLDESFTGWGLEDSDLAIRLQHDGIRHKNARFAAPVFHLWHQENDRSRLEQNQVLLQDVLRTKKIRAQLGVDQYLNAHSSA